jgi:tape measure domain-containing protein
MIDLDIQKFADGKIVIQTDLNTRNFENGLDRIKNGAQKAGNTVKNIVTALGISKIISSAMNEISNSIDGAVTRFDTLNNFSKVMSNLGIGAKESQKSIDKLSDKLMGLPTTLQDGAMAVQRFTSANGDIEKSTDLFLALNNAILAGGASSEIQASALEQLSQSYAKGKPDMMEWRTAMTAMPAQLKQVAKAMGYINADALGEALRDGSVSMDEFMDTIVRLNTEGVDGFKSFEEQARNSTDGVRTALTNMRSRITQGVTAIIESLDKKLKTSNLGGVSDIIINYANSIRDGLIRIGNVISGELSITDFSKEIVDIANKSIETMTANFPRFFEAGAKIVSQMADGLLSADAISRTIGNTINFIDTVLNTITEHFQDMVKKGMEIISNIAQGIEDNLPKITENINKLIDKILGALGDPKFQQEIERNGGEIISHLFVGMIKALPKLIEAEIKIINNIKSTIRNLPLIFFNVGKEVISGFIDGFKQKAKDVGNVIKSWADSVVKKAKDAFKIGSPSKIMRDEIGKWLPLGMYEGFDNELDGVYDKMQRAINFENAKLQSNVETGKVFNTLANTTPVYVKVDADVEMDKTTVGRIITPVVSETLKTGGLR